MIIFCRSQIFKFLFSSFLLKILVFNFQNSSFGRTMHFHAFSISNLHFLIKNVFWLEKRFQYRQMHFYDRHRYAFSLITANDKMHFDRPTGGSSHQPTASARSPKRVLKFSRQLARGLLLNAAGSPPSRATLNARLSAVSTNIFRVV